MSCMLHEVSTKESKWLGMFEYNYSGTWDNIFNSFFLYKIDHIIIINLLVYAFCLNFISYWSR